MSEQRRTKSLVVPLTPEEAAALDSLAAERGLSPERWVQMAINQAGRTTAGTKAPPSYAEAPSVDSDSDSA